MQVEPTVARRHSRRQSHKNRIAFSASLPETSPFVSLSDGAFRLWFNLNCYISRNQTDGLVPESIATRLKVNASRRTTRELTEAGLLEPVDGTLSLRVLTPQTAVVHPARSIRRAIPGWLRMDVLNRDGLCCQLCGGPVERDDVHLDHILPVSKGGATTLRNLQVAHAVCNIRKGARTDWRLT
jgi:5-methylcytosine-specific restriction endonuclease McrA